MLYPMEGEVDEEAGPVDISKAVVRREGRDVSLITFGGSLFKTLDTAEQLSKQGVEVAQAAWRRGQTRRRDC